MGFTRFKLLTLLHFYILSIHFVKFESDKYAIVLIHQMTVINPVRVPASTQVTKCRFAVRATGLYSDQNDDIKFPLNQNFQLKCAIEGNPGWETLFSSPVCSVANGTQFLAAACKEGSLHILNSMSGQRILPPMVLDSGIARMTISQSK